MQLLFSYMQILIRTDQTCLFLWQHSTRTPAQTGLISGLWPEAVVFASDATTVRLFILRIPIEGSHF